MQNKLGNVEKNRCMVHQLICSQYRIAFTVDASASCKSIQIVETKDMTLKQKLLMTLAPPAAMFLILWTGSVCRPSALGALIVLFSVPMVVAALFVLACHIIKIERQFTVIGGYGVLIFTFLIWLSTAQNLNELYGLH